MHTQVLVVFFAVLALAYGYYPSGSAQGSMGGFGGGGMGSYGGRGGSNGMRVSLAVQCNSQIPYVDECNRRCSCQSNRIICPPRPTNGCDNGIQPQVCPNQGSYFQKDCNTCVCIDIGAVCTANQCRK